MRRRWLGVVASLAVQACAHTPVDGSARGHQPLLITETEIVEANVANAFDAIRMLRANFLTHRGQTSLRSASSSDPRVYVDDQPYGGLSSLRLIPSAQIAEIRLYRGWEATTKFGTGNMDGVIAVTTRR
jgi:hypothetical protein